MADSNSEFEREKFLSDQRFRERELILKERDASNKEQETLIKKDELEIKRKEYKRNVMFGPLSLAIIGAILAGGWNAWVADHNAKAQRQLEQAQAEHSRVSKALDEPKTAMEKLKFLLSIGLITEEPLKSKISGYIDQTVELPQQSKPISPPSRPVIATVRRDSNWLGGGNNPNDVCNGFIPEIKSRYSGKDVRISGTSQNHQKDFLGHVTYQYHCDFEVF